MAYFHHVCIVEADRGHDLPPKEHFYLLLFQSFPHICHPILNMLALKIELVMFGIGAQYSLVPDCDGGVGFKFADDRCKDQVGVPGIQFLQVNNQVK